MEKSGAGANGSKDLILRKLKKTTTTTVNNPNKNKQAVNYFKDWEKWNRNEIRKNKKTGETYHFKSFHFMVELSLETSLQINQNEALEVSKLQNGGFRRRFWTTKYLQFFIYYFWILRENRVFGDTIAKVRRTSYAFWKNQLDFGF